MELPHPLELASLIEEWMLAKEIQGTYDYDNLKLSMSSITWSDIFCKSDPSKKTSAYKETCVLARERSPLLVGEPECEVELYSGLLKYGNTDFNQKVNLPFNDLPDYILNFLSIKSLDIDLGSETAKTEPSPYLFNPKPVQEGATAGPIWRGWYGGMFSLIAQLSGDVKIIEDCGSVQEENFKEIVEFLEVSDKTQHILITLEGCEWQVTGICDFSLYS